MNNSLDLILNSRLVAIIRLDDLTCAVPLARALLHGGIVAQEFTLTNPRALAAVSDVLSELAAFSNGQATIGVGSVRSGDQAERAIRSGAQFVVSPIHSSDVTAACRSAGVPAMSGAMTPTEIATAWNDGASIVKVFPARGLGPDYIRDVLAPMPEIPLMPTGGIGLENMQAYFEAGAVAAGVGGQLIDSAAIAAADWDRVANTARAYTLRAARTPLQ
ncbi:MAG: bifunctional 4-hydroxy-2-oxoglutarate aldolase/2-dehydro-3-deoxy-phosphogluconate aldolase [Pirellulaceae bacterium]